MNALQDADEAQAIARAGQAGRVTVATNIAGRGTDIRLDEQARAAGGLHVIAMVLNRSARIDRQLIGRAARHGDPGSAERLLCLDDRVLQQWLPGVALRPLRASTHDPAVPGKEPGAPLPSWLGRALTTCAQHRAQSHDTGVRRLLRRAGHRAREFYGFAGGTE